MRSLVVSDLHLGARVGRDVARREPALQRLVAACQDADRLVLLGDLVEMWEGRPLAALEAAEPILRALGRAVEQVVIVPGNHDGALVRNWIKERGADLGLTDQVPPDASQSLARIVEWLAPAEVSVYYPGIWLTPRVFAHHGHYLDRLLVLPPAVEKAAPQVALKPLRMVPEVATPFDFERAGGIGQNALQNAVESTLPGAVSDAVDMAAGTARGVLLRAIPFVEHLAPTKALAPLSAGVLGWQLRRAGLGAMADAARRLGIDADWLVFGHVHRTGPLPADDPAEWHPDELGPKLINTGSWVYEPLLLSGAGPGHPYWPGGAVWVDDSVDHGTPQLVTLLDDVPPGDLRH